MRHSRHSTLAAIALSLSFAGAFACGGSSTGFSADPGNGGPHGPSGIANGSPCAGAAQCASGLCSNGQCTSGPSGIATSPGPHFGGGGPSSRPLTTGCAPGTASQCGGTCEMSGGTPATVLAPPATICYAGDGDLTPNDPTGVIEQVIETIDGKTYLHLRVTFDPRFVDNTYGVNASSGWVNKAKAGPMGGKAGPMGGKAGPMGGMAAKAAHTFGDLVGSDHVELVLVDSKGDTVLDFDVDYVSQNPDAPCGYGTLGVSGGEGKMLKGDASAIVGVATSIDRNLNGCGYCLITDSPASDDNFTPAPSAPNWDYRVVYEVWVDFSVFAGHGFGGAYIPEVHASPSMASTNTIDVDPNPCPPDWDTPYCPPSVIEEGGNCFSAPPGDGTCPEGTVPDIKNEGQSCVPASY